VPPNRFSARFRKKNGPDGPNAKKHLKQAQSGE